MPISGKDKSSLDRVVGGDERQRSHIEGELGKRFEDQSWSEDLKRAEREKLPVELEALRFANRELNLLREKYGLSAWEIPEKNVHLLRDDPELTKRVFRNSDYAGDFHYENQWVAIVELPSDLETVRTMFHEMIHFASYLSVKPAQFGGASRFAPHGERRLGLRSVDEQNRVFFDPLNEAVTEELTRRLMEKTREIEALDEEWESLDRVRAVRTPEEAAELLALSPGTAPDGSEKLIAVSFDYPQERQALNLLVRKLQERDPEGSRDPEAWFDLFAGAMFNGHLLELARAIEGAFGAGTFRQLGEPQNGEDFLRVVEALEYVDHQD